MKIRSTLLVLAALLGATAASAQTTATTTTTTQKAVVHAKGPATTLAKSPEGLACSKDADAKGLHGKARQTFRSQCKAAARGGAAPTPASTATN